jgi:hypothetical protein
MTIKSLYNNNVLKLERRKILDNPKRKKIFSRHKIFLDNPKRKKNLEVGYLEIKPPDVLTNIQLFVLSS